MRNNIKGMIVGAIASLFAAGAVADYTATQGVGTTFASVVLSTKHYMANMLCDFTSGESQCASVDSSGRLSALAVQSGTWNVNNISGTVSLPTGAATSALQTTGNTTLSSILSALGSPFQAGGSVSITANDPCVNSLKSNAPINATTSGSVITHTTGQKTYICGVELIASAIMNVSLVEGTGSTCGTNTYGLAGGNTASTGWNFETSGSGLTFGSGTGTVVWGSGDTNATGADVCLYLSSSNQVSGNISYVQK